MRSIFESASKEFTREELSFIKSRITVELDWGESVYTKKDIDVMNSIMRKIENTLNIK